MYQTLYLYFNFVSEKKKEQFCIQVMRKLKKIVQNIQKDIKIFNK